MYSNQKSSIAVNTAQQGDVTLRRITSLPEGEKKVIAKNTLVLAEGETTGHYHGIISEDSELFTIGSITVLNLKEQATLTHQEHGPITLEPGLWQVGGVREYDYFLEMARKVVD